MKSFRMLIPLALLMPLLFAAEPARAEVEGRTDASNDVREIRSKNDGEIVYAVVFPKRANGDLVRIRVNHSQSTVNVLVQFRELARTVEDFEFNFRLRTAGLTRRASFSAAPGSWAGGTVAFVRPSSTPAPCAGVKRAVDYRANTAWLSVPRRCLGDPSWVKVAFELLAYDDGLFIDNAYRKGGDVSTVVFGQKVYR